MAAIILPHQWTRQPQGPVEIDGNHPSARGLIIAAYPMGSGLFDAVSSIPSTTSTPANFSRSVVRGALSLQGDGTSGIFHGWPISTAFGGRDPVPAFSILASASVPASSGPFPIFVVYDPYWGEGFGLIFDRTGSWSGITNSILASAGNSIEDYSKLSPNAVNLDSGPQLFGYAITQGGASDWLSYGKSFYSFTGGTYMPQTALGGRRRILYHFSLPWSYSASVQLILAWTRRISVGEYAELYANPWQLFRPLRRKLYSVPASVWTFDESVAPNGVTLTRLQGAYTAITDSPDTPDGNWLTRT